MPFPFDILEKICDNENEPLKYQNTYRLEPIHPFKTDPVDKIIKFVMMNNLEDVNYDYTECPNLCRTIATDIRKRIQKLNFSRHRIVVMVTIIEKASQAIDTTFGYLWDTERDNYSTFSFETRTFHAYCCVFGVYYE